MTSLAFLIHWLMVPSIAESRSFHPYWPSFYNFYSKVLEQLTLHAVSIILKCLDILHKLANDPVSVFLTSEVIVSDCSYCGEKPKVRDCN